MNNDSDYLAGLRQERGYAEAQGKPTDAIDAEIERVADIVVPALEGKIDAAKTKAEADVLAAAGDLDDVVSKRRAKAATKDAPDAKRPTDAPDAKQAPEKPLAPTAPDNAG